MISSDFFSSVVVDDSILFTLASDLRYVHPTICLSERFARKRGATDTSKISIVLQELLSNAIVHGNRNLQGRTVNCRVEDIGEDLFKIVVEDEGAGFDYDGMDMSLPENPFHVPNRGYIVVHQICRSLQFNETGNQVTVLVNVSEQYDCTDRRFSAAAKVKRREG